jgi:chloramphenicol 3-O phosphotransferase
LPAYCIGVRCPVEVIMARRYADPGGGGGQDGRYVTSEPDGSIPDVIFRWERAVHNPGTYDLEVNTSTEAPEACAAAILRRVREGPPVAFSTMAGTYLGPD